MYLNSYLVIACKTDNKILRLVLNLPIIKLTLNNSFIDKLCTYRWELGDFHQGIGSISLHFWSLMKSINPFSDLEPSYFRNSPSFTLKIDIQSHDVIESIPIINLI